MLKVSVIQSEHPRPDQTCQTCLQPLPFKRDLFKLRLPHIINHLLLCATAADKYRRDSNEIFWESCSRLLSDGETPLCDCRAEKLPLPESEGRASREEHRLGLGLRFFEEAEEGMVFDTDLPEDFTAVSAGHQKLQSVLTRTLRDT